MTYRNRWQIIIDLFEATRVMKNTQIQIMQDTYLANKNFQDYFDFLLQEGFISKSDEEEDSYKITKNGEKLFMGLKDMKEMQW